MSLARTEELFLKDHLFVIVKDRGFFSFATREENSNESATKAFQKYSGLKSEVTEQVKTLRAIQVKDSLINQIQGDINQAEQTVQGAPQNDAVGSLQSFTAGCNALVKVKNQAGTLIARKREFNTQLSSAEGSRRRLTTLNREGKAYDQPLIDLITKAKNEADAGKYVAANQTLAATQSTFSTQISLSESDGPKELGEARHKPVYEDKKRRVDEGIKELEALPGTIAQVNELNRMLSNAQIQVNSGNYEKAYKALTGLRGTLDEGREASKTFATTGKGASVKTELKAARDQIARYRKLADLADPATIESGEETINNLLKRLDALNDGPTISSVKEGLTQTATAFQNRADPLNVHAVKARRLLGELDTAVNTLTKMAPAAAVAPRVGKLNAARALVSAQQFEEAAKELDSLDTDVKDDKVKFKGDYDLWVGIETELSGERKQKIVTIMSTARSLEGAASKLLNEIGVAEQHALAHAFKEAQEAGAPIVLKVDQLEADFVKYENAKEGRTEARLLFDTSVSKVKLKLKELELRGDAAALIEQLKRAQDEWNVAIHDIGISRTIEEVKQGGVAAFDVIFNAAEADLKNPETLYKGRLASEQREKTEEQEQKERAFAEKKGQILKKIEFLAQDDPDGAKKQKEKVEQVVPDPVTGVADVHLSRLEVILDKVESKIDDVARAIKADRTQAVKDAKTLNETLDKIQRSNAKYESYIKTVRQQIAAGLGMFAEGSPQPVVNLGKTKMVELKQAVANLEAANSDSPPRGAVGFKAVDLALKALKTELNDDALKTCFPEKRQVLDVRRDKELPDKLHQQSPEAAMQSLTEFRKEITDLKRLAVEAMNKRRAIEVEAARLLEMLSGLNGVPKLKKSLESWIASAAKPGQNGEAKSELALATIAVQIDDVLANPEHRAAGERKANEDEFKAAKAKKDWDASCDIFDKNAMRSATLAYNAATAETRNEPLFNQIKALYKEAKELAGKGTFPVAQGRLRQATHLAEQFAADPLAGQASQRNSLKKVGARWRTAVGKFVLELGQLKKAIEQANKLEPGVIDAQAAAKKIDLAARSFEADVFDPLIAAMTAEGTQIGTIRGRKETALQHVRRFRDSVSSDPLIVHLGKNPFYPSFSTTPLTDALNDLELNLLRA